VAAADVLPQDPDVELEANVFLVEELVADEKQTRSTARPGHSKCVVNGFNRFEVKWADYTKSFNTWECECDIEATPKAEYWEKQAAASQDQVRPSACISGVWFSDAN
jgi:hypothetical protein